LNCSIAEKKFETFEERDRCLGADICPRPEEEETCGFELVLLDNKRPEKQTSDIKRQF
jgi:hypothetical protein